MKTFLQWAEDNKIELPIFTDEVSEKKPTSEDRVRGGIKIYPDAYVAAQYPKAYFAPNSATAYVDLLNRREIKSTGKTSK